LAFVWCPGFCELEASVLNGFSMSSYPSQSRKRVKRRLVVGGVQAETLRFNLKNVQEREFQSGDSHGISVTHSGTGHGDITSQDNVLA
jgi:hypothetical protein